MRWVLQAVCGLVVGMAVFLLVPVPGHDLSGAPVAVLASAAVGVLLAPPSRPATVRRKVLAVFGGAAAVLAPMYVGWWLILRGAEDVLSAVPPAQGSEGMGGLAVVMLQVLLALRVVCNIIALMAVACAVVAPVSARLAIAGRPEVPSRPAEGTARRWPRVRFRTRSAMIAVAICALLLGLAPIVYDFWWLWTVTHVVDVESVQAKLQGMRMPQEEIGTITQEKMFTLQRGQIDVLVEPGGQASYVVREWPRGHPMAPPGDTEIVITMPAGKFTIENRDLAGGKFRINGKEYERQPAPTGKRMTMRINKEGQITLASENLDARGERVRPAPPAVNKGRVTGTRPSVPRVLPVAEGVVTGVAFGPEGRIAASHSRGVVVFDARGEQVRPAPLEVKEGFVHCVAFGPDGRIAAGCFFFVRGGGVEVFDARGKRLLRKPAVERARVTSVAFSPEGRIAAGYFVDGGGVMVFDAP